MEKKTFTEWRAIATQRPLTLEESREAVKALREQRTAMAQRLAPKEKPKTQKVLAVESAQAFLDGLAGLGS